MGQPTVLTEAMMRPRDPLHAVLRGVSGCVGGAEPTGYFIWELMLGVDEFNHDWLTPYQRRAVQRVGRRRGRRRLALRRRAEAVGCPPAAPPKPSYPGPDGCQQANCTIHMDTDARFWTYAPPSTKVPFTCWYAWDEGGPAETGGTLHYCNRAGSTASFAVNGSRAVDLVYKAGPDCGMFNVTLTRPGGAVVALRTDLDAYSALVNWESVARLSTVDAIGGTYTLTVSASRNPASTDSWMQLVPVNVFH